MSIRLGVNKTYKMYVGGAFIRSESGRSAEAQSPTGEVLANVCRASRKDVRDAVKAARKAVDGWAARSGMNRGQILYRAAEMLEARADEFTGLLTAEVGAADAADEVAAAVDALVWYAGWADKYPAVLGSVNPVSGPFFNFSFPEPMGVVGVVAPPTPALLGLVLATAPVIVGGNATVVLASERGPIVACEFAEVLATSDLPGGVVNLLTGSVAETLPTLARHMDVNALWLADGEHAETAYAEAPANVKRVWVGGAEARSLTAIERFQETKTVWHPVGV